MQTLERPVVSLRQRGIKPQRKGARSRQIEQAASKFQSSSATAALPLDTKLLSSASILSVVQLLHTSLSCFISGTTPPYLSELLYLWYSSSLPLWAALSLVQLLPTSLSCFISGTTPPYLSELLLHTSLSCFISGTTPPYLSELLYLWYNSSLPLWVALSLVQLLPTSLSCFISGTTPPYLSELLLHTSLSCFISGTTPPYLSELLYLWYNSSIPLWVALSLLSFLLSSLSLGYSDRPCS